jgi:hypothetical protein
MILALIVFLTALHKLTRSHIPFAARKVLFARRTAGVAVGILLATLFAPVTQGFFLIGLFFLVAPMVAGEWAARAHAKHLGLGGLNGPRAMTY